MSTWIVHPDEQGPYPLVIFLMDALGIREELRDMCRRIASVGYGVYLPDLFYRYGSPSFDPAPLAQGRVVSDSSDSPHLLIGKMAAESYFAWAQDDPVAPAAHAALHGFTFPERYCYHKQAAGRVWSRLFSLFRRTINRADSRDGEI